MAQGISRTVLKHSSLVRALDGLAIAEVSESKQSFAERLGQWLGFNEALSLYSVLNPGGAELAKSGSRTVEPGAIREEFRRVRANLVDALSAPPPAPGKADAGSTPEFAPYHRHYLARQRQMSTDIGLLRASVRTAMARRSPALKRLAALDAVLDQALAARERNLLATVPAFLNKRFEHLHAAHQSAMAATDNNAEADTPAHWMQPGGWLATYCGEMQAVLLAELELRLQPLAGLIAALENEVAAQQ